MLCLFTDHFFQFNVPFYLVEVSRNPKCRYWFVWTLPRFSLLGVCLLPICASFHATHRFRTNFSFIWMKFVPFCTVVDHYNLEPRVFRLVVRGWSPEEMFWLVVVLQTTNQRIFKEIPLSQSLSRRPTADKELEKLWARDWDHYGWIQQGTKNGFNQMRRNARENRSVKQTPRHCWKLTPSILINYHHYLILP